MLALRIYGLPAWVLLLIAPVLVALAMLGRAANKRARHRVAAAMQRDLARRGFRLVGFTLSPKSQGDGLGPRDAGGDEAEYSVTFRDEPGRRLKAKAIAVYDGGQIAFVWAPPLHKVLTAAERDAAASALADMADADDAAVRPGPDEQAVTRGRK